LAKTNWLQHCEKFSKQADQSASARQKYCEKHELNPNSFRRELTVFKKSAGSESEVLPEKKAAKSSNKPDTEKPNTETKTGKKNELPGTSPAKRVPSKKSAGSTQIPKIAVTVNSRPNVVNRADGTRTFTKGNTAGLKHGAYSRVLSSLDLEVDAQDFSLADLNQLVKSRVLGMMRIRQKRFEGVEAVYARGDKLTRPVIAANGEEIQEPMTLIEALESVEYSGIEPFTGLVRQSLAIEEKMVSMLKTEREMAHLSQGEIIDITADLLARRAAEEMSATECCTMFASVGIPAPRILLLEAEKELKELAPPPPETGGVSQAEIDAAREASKARRIASAQEEAERVAWFNQTMAGLGEVGGVRVTESPIESEQSDIALDEASSYD
jgi:hypothetical protein